ncbi:Radical SAM superfamily protein [Syntrophus gentianae]|uniref:Radical SAM superfamily protein n=1 Tax=Syntrophus gentianae TaxID=43775 RepID=A0A1H8BEZ8_9BACT|nr:radical SAM protein [Syntrophus gentianae]SEM81403.1 Radical SAM superfamily protein [Syntrophus gentianae]
MEKVKRLINCSIPVSACNFHCNYCYISHYEGRRKNRMPKFKYDADYIGKALSANRLGGICLFNLCGDGETLLPREVPKIIEALLKEGHFLEVVTNGTLTERFDEIAKFDIELLKRLEFKFSFHYMELLHTDTINDFFNNIKKMKKVGCSFTVELTPHDELIPFIQDIKTVCKEKLGAFCQVTVARNDASDMDYLTKLSLTEYKKTWGTFNSPMFEFKLSTFGIKRKEYCYAGDWVLYVNLETGKTSQCYCSRFEQNIFENLNKPITFLPIGKNCTMPHCYNSHALLTLGAIPELDTITYSDVRNRQCDDGTEWLNPEVKEFFSGKFCENNAIYTTMEKIKKELQIGIINPKSILHGVRQKTSFIKRNFKKI